MAPAGQRGAKLMVSYGGKIERCPGGGGGEERYVGGEHRIVEISRSASLMDLRTRLAGITGFSDFSVRYGFSGEGQDALRDVATDDDVRCMLDWVLHRDLLVGLLGKDPAKIPRVRVFLARTDAPSPPVETLAAPALVRRSATPPTSLSAKPPLPPAISKRIASAPSLSATSTADTPPSKPPLPPALSRRIASAPSLSATSTADTTTSCSTAPPPPGPSKRIASAPSLSTTSTADTPPSKAPLPPALRKRIASAPSLSATSTDDTASSTTTASSAAGTTSATSHITGPDAAAFHGAKQRSLACPAPVFLVPIVVAPVIVYRPAIHVFIVPAFSCSIVVGLCCA